MERRRIDRIPAWVIQSGFQEFVVAGRGRIPYTEIQYYLDSSCHIPVSTTQIARPAPAVHPTESDCCVPAPNFVDLNFGVGGKRSGGRQEIVSLVGRQIEN